MSRFPIQFVLLFLPFDAPTKAQANAPLDPDFAQQWGLLNTGQSIQGALGAAGADIDAVAAWTIHSKGPLVKVAIVGAGVDPHGEYGDRLLEGGATIGDSYDSLDGLGVGTHLAGIIAARRSNNFGIAGICPEVELLPIRVVEGMSTTQTAVADGIESAIEQGAQVILVAVTLSSAGSRLVDAVALAVEHDALIIAPVGNQGGTDIPFPAALAEVVAVSATNNMDELASFSNYGVGVDIAAPGQDIWSTAKGEGFEFRSSTAAAAAFVAGAACLLRSYAPELSAGQVREALMVSADDLGPPGPDQFFGQGRLNLRRALEMVDPPPLRLTPIDPWPTSVSPGGGREWWISITPGTEQLNFDSPKVWIQAEVAVFFSISLSHVKEDIWSWPLPTFTCGRELEYYLEARGESLSSIRTPTNAPLSVHRVLGEVRTVLFHDDFESDQGWMVIAEEPYAPAGQWTRGVPIATTAQPGFDFSPDAGRMCMFTGQHFGGSPGTSDVDGGPLRLVSPDIELGANDVEISYAAWLYSSQGTTDALKVDVSVDHGVTWWSADKIGGTTSWITRKFRLGDVVPQAGKELRVRFSVADETNDSLTEAAVDEMTITAIGCEVAATDFNGDGKTGEIDIHRLIRCLSGPTPAMQIAGCKAEDLNETGSVDLRDFAKILQVYPY